MAQATVSDEQLQQSTQQLSEIKNAFGQATAAAGTWAKGNAERLAYYATQNVKEGIHNAYGMAAGAVNGVEQGVVNAATGVANGATGAVHGATQTLANAFQGMANGAAAAQGQVGATKEAADAEFAAKAKHYGDMADAEFNDVLSLDGSNMRDRGYSSSMSGMGE